MVAVELKRERSEWFKKNQNRAIKTGKASVPVKTLERNITMNHSIYFYKKKEREFPKQTKSGGSSALERARAQKKTKNLWLSSPGQATLAGTQAATRPCCYLTPKRKACTGLANKALQK